MPELAVFLTPQGTLSALLLARIEVLLPLRLQVGLSLRARQIGLSLRRRRLLPLAFGTQVLLLAFCAQLLSLNVPLLLDLPLLLLNIAIDHRRRLMSLRLCKMRTCNTRS